MSQNYKSAGVDTAGADAWVEAIAAQVGGTGPSELRSRLRSGVGDYAAVYALHDELWLAVSCDGVGTKILWGKEGLGTVEGLAQDLVAMNANDLLCVGATPILFLDYLAVGSLDLVKEGGELSGFIRGLSKACAESGMIVVGGETAQMPDIYGKGGYDLAGFAVGALKPTEKLGVERIQPGAELWGWPSTGPHSNGFTWLRRLFNSNEDAAFIREHLMAPTRLYARDFLGLRKALREQGIEAGLQAAFHVTGSGVLNLLRAQPNDRTIGFDLNSWPRERPAWLEAVAHKSGASNETLWTAFNMGFGFTVVLDEDLVKKHQALLNSLKLTRLGQVIEEPVIRVGGLELK